jgi:hypothetical protein
MSSPCLIYSSVYFYSSTIGERGGPVSSLVRTLTSFSPSFLGDFERPLGSFRANVFNFFYKSASSYFLA